MHGLGNDFVVIETSRTSWTSRPRPSSGSATATSASAPTASSWCDRRPPADADFFMLVLQRRRHAAEMCGNGDPLLREVRRRPRPGRCRPRRAASWRRSAACSRSRSPGTTTADVHRPRWTWASRSSIRRWSRRPTLRTTTTVVDCPLETELGTFRRHRVSRWATRTRSSGSTTSTTRRSTPSGPLIENASDASRSKTNVEFAQVVDDDATIRAARVGARGRGDAGVRDRRVRDARRRGARRGRTRREAAVELPGGELAIRWAEDGHVYMTGPAEEVFTGVIARRPRTTTPR